MKYIKTTYKKEIEIEGKKHIKIIGVHLENVKYLTSLKTSGGTLNSYANCQGPKNTADEDACKLWSIETNCSVVYRFYKEAGLNIKRRYFWQR